MLIYLLDNDDDDVPHPICAESENICEHKKYRWITKKKKNKVCTGESFVALRQKLSHKYVSDAYIYSILIHLL